MVPSVALNDLQDRMEALQWTKSMIALRRLCVKQHYLLTCKRTPWNLSAPFSATSFDWGLCCALFMPKRLSELKCVVVTVCVCVCVCCSRLNCGLASTILPLCCQFITVFFLYVCVCLCHIFFLSPTHIHMHTDTHSVSHTYGGSVMLEVLYGPTWHCCL